MSNAPEGVGVGVAVPDGVGVGVAVPEGVGVGVAVPEGVGVGVAVGVGVGVADPDAIAVNDFWAVTDMFPCRRAITVNCVLLR